MFATCTSQEAESATSFFGALVWYADPHCLEKEMLPPFVTAYNEMVPPSPKYLAKAFTLIYHKNNAYKTLQGALRMGKSGSVTFQGSSECVLMDFKPWLGLNKKVYNMAQRLGKVKSNTNLPVLKETKCDFKPRDKILDADKIWVAGLLLSRFKVTTLAVRYVYKEFSLKARDMFTTKDVTKECKNIFYAWWPSPKPSKIGDWLGYLSDKKTSFFPKGWVSEGTPLVEGFYRVALTSSTPGNTKYDATAEAVFNDGSSKVRRCYTDYPYDPTNAESQVGFVHEQGRVRVSLSIPLRCRAPGSVSDSDWGHLPHVAMGYIFLLPGGLDFPLICEPVRSTNGRTFRNKHGLVRDDVDKHSHLKRLLEFANNDAAINSRVYIKNDSLTKLIFKSFESPFCDSVNHSSVEDSDIVEIPVASKNIEQPAISGGTSPAPSPQLPKKNVTGSVAVTTRSIEKKQTISSTDAVSKTTGGEKPPASQRQAVASQPTVSESHAPACPARAVASNTALGCEAPASPPKTATSKPSVGVSNAPSSSPPVMAVKPPVGGSELPANSPQSVGSKPGIGVSKARGSPPTASASNHAVGEPEALASPQNAVASKPAVVESNPPSSLLKAVALKPLVGRSKPSSSLPQTAVCKSGTDKLKPPGSPHQAEASKSAADSSTGKEAQSFSRMKRKNQAKSKPTAAGNISVSLTKTKTVSGDNEPALEPENPKDVEQPTSGTKSEHIAQKQEGASDPAKVTVETYTDAAAAKKLGAQKNKATLGKRVRKENPGNESSLRKSDRIARQTGSSEQGERAAKNRRLE